jgi:hypothetical protein
VPPPQLAPRHPSSEESCGCEGARAGSAAGEEERTSEKGSERASERASEREREPDFVRGWKGDQCVYGYSERPLTETPHSPGPAATHFCFDFQDSKRSHTHECALNLENV